MADITVDDPYQLPNGDWACLVWRDARAFPCGGETRATAITIADEMACALALHDSEEAVLGEVARTVMDLKLN